MVRGSTVDYACACRLGFTDELCLTPRDNACLSNPCRNGGTCDLLTLSEYKCRCPPGWSGEAVGTWGTRHGDSLGQGVLLGSLRGWGKALILALIADSLSDGGKGGDGPKPKWGSGWVSCRPPASLRVSQRAMGLESVASHMSTVPELSLLPSAKIAPTKSPSCGLHPHPSCPP